MVLERNDDATLATVVGQFLEVLDHGGPEPLLLLDGVRPLVTREDVEDLRSDECGGVGVALRASQALSAHLLGAHKAHARCEVPDGQTCTQALELRSPEELRRLQFGHYQEIDHVEADIAGEVDEARIGILSLSPRHV